MTVREQAAFTAGVRHAADLALIAALSVEIRPDAGAVRQRAAIEALRGFSEALKAQTGTDPATTAPQPLTASPAPSAPLSDQRHASIAAGYTGDACPSCQSFTMKRSGTCVVCDTCGSTTGCS